MKKYVFAYLSFYDNDLKQVVVEANDEIEGIKKGLVEICEGDEAKNSQIEWNKELPNDVDKLKSSLFDCDASISIIEIFR